MAGFKQRYKIRWVDGTIRTVVAQSYKGAKIAFIETYSPQIGGDITVWPQGEPHAKKLMRIGDPD